MNDPSQSVGNARPIIRNPSRVASSNVCVLDPHNHIELEHKPNKNRIDVPNGILHKMSSNSKASEKEPQNLVLLNRLPKPNTSTFFFTLNQHDQIQPKRSARQQVGRSTRHSEDGPFVICCASPVKIPVFACQREWLRIPSISGRGDHIIMAGGEKTNQ